MLLQLKAFWNRKVLTWRQNVISVGARRMSVRRAFHSLGAAAKKGPLSTSHPSYLLKGQLFQKGPLARS